YVFLLFCYDCNIFFVFFFLIIFLVLYSFFFFNDTATTEIYTLSLTTLFRSRSSRHAGSRPVGEPTGARRPTQQDRKSTRLNSSHDQISYAVFCLNKKTTHYFLLTMLELLEQRLLEHLLLRHG